MKSFPMPARDRLTPNIAFDNAERRKGLAYSITYAYRGRLHTSALAFSRADALLHRKHLLARYPRRVITRVTLHPYRGYPE